jgi:hypothetical protein
MLEHNGTLNIEVNTGTYLAREVSYTYEILPGIAYNRCVNVLGMSLIRL